MPNSKPSQALKNHVNQNVKQVVLGNLQFKAWFDSRYPEELVRPGDGTLYVCRWCFRYTCDRQAYLGHTPTCGSKDAPLGTQIYDHGGYSVWEVDGEDQKLFAQNLSLFAKLFLDHKSVFFDVSSFLYYLLVYTNPTDPDDYHVLGFFSKEKMSWDANNLACILIFPPFQHKQLGKLLMGISYKLSAWEWKGGVIGGPEKPLSEMGHKSYVRFWEERMARFLLHVSANAVKDEQSKANNVKPQPTKKYRKKPPREQMSIQDIGQATGMLAEDVLTALNSMGVVQAEKKPVKRKRASQPDGEDEPPTAVIKRSNVLEWSKSHRVNLRDPVSEDGFLGEWATGSDNESD
ncbi:histone acetyltransferase MYST2 [Nannizzia gypsea CBS 118893]|uniref:histone acetyltransferase n=1 Tax=Arthroderma gypseum (strain ATCC MYA-4604 / CBS 118893) TaxID=535722 RepID=E5R0H3_ARTGP|nr:histone acetyltransferase MYST2 [Nannizzia gypsea CBS 118893]EFQ97532.1 histone acetyltransferase MYST2 [Nannizzia gypsea CBS 118893]